MSTPYTRSDLASVLERGGAVDTERLAATVADLLPEDEPEGEEDEAGEEKAPAEKRAVAKKK